MTDAHTSRHEPSSPDPRRPSHYSQGTLDPWALAKSQGWFEPMILGQVVKYVTRFPFKNGIEDLRKAQHCLEALMEHLDLTPLDADVVSAPAFEFAAAQGWIKFMLQGQVIDWLVRWHHFRMDELFAAHDALTALVRHVEKQDAALVTSA